MNARAIHYQLETLVEDACRRATVALPTLRPPLSVSEQEMHERVGRLCLRLTQSGSDVSCLFVRERCGSELHYHGVVTATRVAYHELSRVIDAEWLRAFPELDPAIPEMRHVQPPNPNAGGVCGWATRYIIIGLHTQLAVDSRVIATGRFERFPALLKSQWRRNCECCGKVLPPGGRSDQRFCSPKSNCRTRHYRMKRRLRALLPAHLAANLGAGRRRKPVAVGS